MARPFHLVIVIIGKQRERRDLLDLFRSRRRPSNTMESLDFVHEAQVRWFLEDVCSGGRCGGSTLSFLSDQRDQRLSARFCVRLATVKHLNIGPVIVLDAP